MDKPKEEGTTTLSGWVAWTLLGFMAIGFGTVVTVAGALVMTAYATLNPKTLIQTLFNCEDAKNCVVKTNSGGQGDKFLEAAFSLKAGDLISIDGPCNSACAIFADYARPHVCVTKNAAFGFHKGWLGWVDGTALGYFSATQSKDIMLWVYANGDFPDTSNGKPYLEMRYPVTNNYWPLCPIGEVAQKERRLEVRAGKKVSTVNIQSFQKGPAGAK